MASKKIVSSDLKRTRSNIHVASTSGGTNKVEEGEFRKSIGLKRNSSIPKLVKTAIVKPYNFAADSKGTAEELSDKCIQNRGKNSNASNSTTSPNSGESHTGGESLEKTKANVKSLLANRKSTAHSGISFLATPKKCTVPRTFNMQEKQKHTVRELKTKPDSKSSKVSAAEAVTKPSSHHRKEQSKVKSKAPITKKPSDLQNLSQMSSTVLEDAPPQLVKKKFVAHSGVGFKSRKLPGTGTNPFAASCSSKGSQDDKEEEK